MRGYRNINSDRKLGSNDIPNPPRSVLSLLGPGIVLIAMGLGSGEFVLWPYLVSQFGLGILWGAVVGIFFQYIVSNETGRFTIASGKSVFIGFKKLFRYFPHWFILSTFLSFAWPGIIGSSGEILGRLFNITDFKWITITLLIIIGLIFTFGGKVYQNLERVQKIFLIVSLPILLFIVVLIIDPNTLLEIPKGLLGFGNGYILFPSGILIGQFLGAVAYSGAGGNLILSHSFYIQDKGHGMAYKEDSQLEAGTKSFIDTKHQIFTINEFNLNKFKRWFNFIALEQFITFVIIGIVTIVLLSVISYELVYPSGGANSLEFIFLEASKLAKYIPFLGSILLIIGAVFLFTTQLGVFESTSRIMSENFLLISERFKRFNRNTVFFIFLWSQIIFAIVITLLNIAAPLEILFINTTFSAISMLVLSIAILWLNTSKLLPREIHPSLFRKIFLFLSFIFFLIFVTITLFFS